MNSNNKVCFFFSSRRRHTRYWRDWSSDVCSSDLFADFRILHDGLNLIEGGGCGALVSEAPRQQLGVLHAVRLALIHEIFLLAAHIPQFSNQHNTTHARLLLRVLHLDIPTAVSHLERIFPTTTDTAATGDFGERTTYVSDEA